MASRNASPSPSTGRARYERFNIEVIATTESPLDDLEHHRAIRNCGWQGRVITTYRPDAVVDPEFEGFRENVAQLGALAGCDTQSWLGYLEAHRRRRVFFKQHGATATDHSRHSASARHGGSTIPPKACGASAS